MGVVTFLPGTSGRGSFWSLVVDRLPGIDTRLVDFPGLGGVPADRRVQSFDDLVALVIAELDQPCALVGQSMGGYVAARVALARPDLVTHLVLAVTSAGVDRNALGLEDWRPTWNPGEPGSPWVAAPQPTLEADLPSITVPTLLIWASDDPISPLPIGRRLNQLVPNSELVVYTSSDHWVVHQEIDDVSRRIRDHLGLDGSAHGRPG
jgi:pimeloyl-ACP methyl ester carboxylesterase